MIVIDFVVSELYFMIWHPDQEEKYVVPESIVFLGKNMEEGREDGDAWYFQDTDSFCTNGSAFADHPGLKKSHADSRIYRLRVADLPQVTDSHGLWEELVRCATRRSPTTTGTTQ